MKLILLISLLLIASNVGISQTTMEDVHFFMSQDFQMEQYGEYVVQDGGHWGYTENGLKRNIKFKEISIDTNDYRGAVLIYQELEDGQLEQEVFFVPQKNSADSIWRMSFGLLEEVGDVKKFRALLYAVMKYAANK